MPHAQQSQVQNSSANLPALQGSDDECVRQLALLIENRNAKTLEQVAKLISRLAVPIE